MHDCKPQRVMFLTTGLGRGGAEASLLQMVKATLDAGLDVRVLSLLNVGDCLGDYANEIAALGVPVTGLRLDRWRSVLPGALRLWRLLRSFNPDVLVTWMYHANLVGGVLGSFCGVRRIQFNIRHSSLAPSSLRFATRVIVRLGGWVAKLVAESITFNSYRAAGVHVAAGYPLKLARVIHSGFDTDVFRPSKTERAAVRAELGLTEDQFVIGILAREDPVKNHNGFFTSVQRVLKQHAHVAVIAAGTGIDTHNAVLLALLGRLEIRDRVHLLGRRADVPAVLNALDVSVLSSISESFPRVLGEALACGVPCVSTDAGDVRSLVGDCGIVVADVDGIAGAIEKMMALPCAERIAIGARGRRHIENNFSQQQVVDRFLRQLQQA